MKENRYSMSKMEYWKYRSTYDNGDKSYKRGNAEGGGEEGSK